MRKQCIGLLATTVLSLPAAYAQSQVNLYGVVDVSLQYASGSSHLLSMDSGTLNGSRWGMRGSEDLGNGMAATFRLEGGFNADSGTLAQGGRAFGRHSTVGLSSPWGAIRLGRALTPIGAFSEYNSTLGTKPADVMSVSGALAVTTLYRSDNSIFYDSPNFNGLSFASQWSTRIDGAEALDRSGRNYGVSLFYLKDGIQGGAAYHTLKPIVAGPRQRALQLNGGYNFGLLSVKAIYNRDDLGLAHDKTIAAAEIGMTLGPTLTTVGFGKVRHTTGAAFVNDDARVITLQTIYSLSKRTAVYLFHTRVHNDPGAKLGYAAPRPGHQSYTTQVGMRHFF